MFEGKQAVRAGGKILLGEAMALRAANHGFRFKFDHPAHYFASGDPLAHIVYSLFQQGAGPFEDSYFVHVGFRCPERKQILHPGGQTQHFINADGASPPSPRSASGASRRGGR